MPKVFLSFFFVRLAFAEVALWKNNVTEFRADGSCLMVNTSKDASPPKIQYDHSPNRYYPCGDPNYELMRQCKMANFYGDQLPEESDVTKKDDGTVLFLVDGCVQCPSGRAEVGLQLVNSFPSGNWFSGCDEEHILVSMVNVVVSSQSSRDGIAMDGTFSLGGVLRERKCGGFFGIGAGREGTFQSLTLELTHNCGRKRSMLLKVNLPKLDIPAIKARGKIAELKGISINLGISGAGWDTRFVDYGMVRPKQLMPERPQSEEGTFGERWPTEGQARQREEQTQNHKGLSMAPRTNAPQGRPTDLSTTERPAAGQIAPPPRIDQQPNESIASSIASSNVLQYAAIGVLFLLLLLFGAFFRRCFLQRRR